MSEHTPLTEALEEIAAEATGKNGKSILQPGAAYALGVLADLVKAGPGSSWADVAAGLAARTSTATADTGRKAWERAVLERVVATMPACRETPDFMHALSTAMLETRNDEATADTGLRERVEALADEWKASPDRTWIANLGDELQDLLDRFKYPNWTAATAAPITECEHDPVYDRTIYECGHAHGYCRHCGETTEPCAPTTDTGARDE